jgi:putative endonuclease
MFSFFTQHVSSTSSVPAPAPSRMIVGQQGEDLVASHLVREGYRMRHRNVRIRGGELDLVVQKGNVLAFVEVKTRTNKHFALSTLITPRKQALVARAAAVYLQDQRIELSSCVIRFDVALVESETVTYIENAFTPPYNASTNLW